jgi:translation elongation factor EF-1alpha
VNERDIERFKRDAIANNRESWWIAYLMDQEISEREKGVTENVSRVCFETPNRRYTLTDCGGHQKYVSLMTNAVLSANIAIVIVSAI